MSLKWNKIPPHESIFQEIAPPSVQNFKSNQSQSINKSKLFGLGEALYFQPPLKKQDGEGIKAGLWGIAC